MSSQFCHLVFGCPYKWWSSSSSITHKVYLGSSFNIESIYEPKDWIHSPVWSPSSFEISPGWSSWNKMQMHGQHCGQHCQQHCHQTVWNCLKVRQTAGFHANEERSISIQCIATFFKYVWFRVDLSLLHLTCQDCTINTKTDCSCIHLKDWKCFVANNLECIACLWFIPLLYESIFMKCVKSL